MSYTKIEDGIYECDGCEKEMSHTFEYGAEAVICGTEGCEYEGIKHTIWMSQFLLADTRTER